MRARTIIPAVIMILIVAATLYYFMVIVSKPFLPTSMPR